MPGPRKIRLLVVDDSAVARTMITDSLARDPEIEVVATAVDPYAAREKILTHNPDVMTLDLEMPRMDGLTFLKVLMRHRPMPVVVVSASTTDGSSKALEALRSGAVDFAAKPEGPFNEAQSATLAHKIKAAAERQFQRRAESDDAANPRSLILIGASTGGTDAVKTVLSAMPAGLPPICVVQHIPAHFSTAFANRLNSVCAMDVHEARSGEELMPSTAIIAPGGRHLMVRWNGSRYISLLNDGPAVHHQRPAVDVLFDSVVKAGGARHCVAALLTGMGRDGADSLLRLKQKGAQTIAQDEATCVVFGMPREAIKLGAAMEVLPLQEIGAELTRQARQLSHAPAAAFS
jgi:two-component system chemotaxis response regulator CheB